MRAVEALGAIALRACARWPGAALTTFVLAVYVVGALIDSEIPL
jgi:hypothetical protein